MAQLSTTIRNAELTTLLSTIGASAVLRFNVGTIPVNCAASRTGTQVLSMALPATYFNAASAGVVTQAGTWSATVATQGVIGYYSLYDSGVTTVHIQGTVGCALWLASTAYVVGQTRVNGANSYQLTTAGTSAASGGPTGTGAGIADGTAVWSYLGLAVASPDLLLDNVNPVATSTVTLTGETLTALGA